MQNRLRVVLRWTSVLVGLDGSNVAGLRLHEVLDESVGRELKNEGVSLSLDPSRR